MKKKNKTSLGWVIAVLTIFAISWATYEAAPSVTTLTFFAVSAVVLGVILVLEVQRVANDDEQYRGDE